MGQIHCPSDEIFAEDSMLSPFCDMANDVEIKGEENNESGDEGRRITNGQR